MAAITWANVIALPNAAFLSRVTETAQGMILAYVNAELPPGNYDNGAPDGNGPQYLLARCYMAAHIAMVGPRWGFVDELKEDDLDIGYQMPPIPQSAAFWCSTGFGMAFWQMRRTSLGRLGFAL